MRRRRRGSLREPVSGGTARGRPSPSRAGSPGPTPARPTPSPFAVRSWREAVERDPTIPAPWFWIGILEELFHLVGVAATATLALVARFRAHRRRHEPPRA